MRGLCARILGIAIVVVFAGTGALADGPQFTGLLNIYNTSSSGFSETSNSLALMDKNGPVAGNVVAIPGNWSDVVVAPGGATFYTITSNVVWKWNASTQIGTPLPAPSTGIDTGWMVGETWDTTRNRLIVASLSGTGYFYSYLDASNQWNLISTLQQVDLRSIAYRPSNDTIYAIPNDPRPLTTQLFTYNASGQKIGALNLSGPLSSENSGDDLDWQMMLASDGELAVIAPRFVPAPGGGTVAGNWLYLINPDTGVINYSAPLPVPDPGMAGLVALSVALLRRRTPHLLGRIKTTNRRRMRCVLKTLAASSYH